MSLKQLQKSVVVSGFHKKDLTDRLKTFKGACWGRGSPWHRKSAIDSVAKKPFKFGVRLYNKLTQTVSGLPLQI